MRLSDFDYNLPDELIAQRPASRRRESRLMVLDRKNQSISHRKFPDVIEYLNEDDALVLNNTAVIPARLKAEREHTGAKLEVFIVRKIADNTYQALVKPGKRARQGDILILNKTKKRLRVEEDNITDKIVTFMQDTDADKVIEKEGQVPLPPYIKRQPSLSDKKRYQTVYASKKGAVAAPTAGLHFDKKFLKRIESKGISICYLTLHVSYGTFKPINEADLKKDKLHPEYFNISSRVSAKLNKLRSGGGRVVAVGTTTCRALESAVKDNRLEAISAQTDIFIYPPYKFKFTDALITNFHLPRSSLLMMVSAFCSDIEGISVSQGHKFIRQAYQEAIKKKYRFYSYGDAMLII